MIFRHLTRFNTSSGSVPFDSSESSRLRTVLISSIAALIRLIDARDLCVLELSLVHSFTTTSTSGTARSALLTSRFRIWAQQMTDPDRALDSFMPLSWFAAPSETPILWQIDLSGREYTSPIISSTHSAICSPVWDPATKMKESLRIVINL